MRACDGLILRAVMIAALLCAQLGGLVHGISHLSGGTAQAEAWQAGKLVPADHHCGLCDAYAQISGAIGVGIHAFVPERIPDTVASARFDSWLSRSSVPFAARAPPRSA